jgi:hypothetical protein
VRAFSKSFAGVARSIEVDNEGDEFFGKSYAREEEVVRGIDTSGGPVGWVVGGVYISCREERIVSLQSFVNPPEDAISFVVATAAGPPPFNDTLVVAKDLEALERVEAKHCAYE